MILRERWDILEALNSNNLIILRNLDHKNKFIAIFSRRSHDFNSGIGISQTLPNSLVSSFYFWWIIGIQSPICQIPRTLTPWNRAILIVAIPFFPVRRTHGTKKENRAIPIWAHVTIARGHAACLLERSRVTARACMLSNRSSPWISFRAGAGATHDRTTTRGKNPRADENGTAHSAHNKRR